MAIFSLMIFMNGMYSSDACISMYSAKAAIDNEFGILNYILSTHCIEYQTYQFSLILLSSYKYKCFKHSVCTG